MLEKGRVCFGLLRRGLIGLKGEVPVQKRPIRSHAMRALIFALAATLMGNAAAALTYDVDRSVDCTAGCVGTLTLTGTITTDILGTGLSPDTWSTGT